MIADDQHWDCPHVMLIDFGMAKNFSGNRAGGTPGYMPPEFWQYNLWTPKGDVFAMAVMFWSIYNFQQGGPFAVPDAPPYNRIKQATISQPMDCSRFPPGLKEIVEAMSQKDFRKRPTAKEVQQSPYFQHLSDQEEGEPLDPEMVQHLIAAAERTDAQNLIAMKISEGQNLGQMKKMNQLFRQLDGDDDGTVETNEALTILTQCGLDPQAAQGLVDAIIGEDGKIHYSEFMARMISSTTALTAQSLADVFKQLDDDGNGYLSREEVAKLMASKNMASMMNDRSPDSLLQDMDADGDGAIDFNEFCNVMLGRKEASAYQEGDKVEYFSPSYGDWIPCVVTEVNRSGAIQVNCKVGAWLNTEAQAERIRKAQGGITGGYGRDLLAGAFS